MAPNYFFREFISYKYTEGTGGNVITARRAVPLNFARSRGKFPLSRRNIQLYEPVCTHSFEFTVLSN